MGIKRLQYELKRLEALPLRHIIDEMASHGDSKVVMAFNGTQSQPVAALALITGPDTESHLKALDQPIGGSLVTLRGKFERWCREGWLGGDADFKTKKLARRKSGIYEDPEVHFAWHAYQQAMSDHGCSSGDKESC